MMGLVRAWLRLQLRRRWRQLLVLALLITLAAATVLTAIAGARRGASSVDRLLAVSNPAHVSIVPNVAGSANVDWSAIAALPHVETMALFAPDAPILADELPFGLDDAGLINIPLDRVGLDEIERPVVLTGRAADPTRPDEAVVTTRFVETFGLGVGDVVTLRLFSPERVDAIAAALVEPTDPDGPVVPTRIVGVVASSYFGDDLGAAGRILPSPGLAATYPGSVRGADGMVEAAALIRLQDGPAGVTAFREAVARVTGNAGIGVATEPADKAVHTRELVRFQAAWLLAFGLVALAAAALAVGQAVGWHARSVASDLGSLRAVGLTGAEFHRLVAAGPLIAAVVGTITGIGIAIVASGWFPVGSAAAFDPQPGISADPLVLGIGALAAPLLTVAAGALATRPLRRHPEPVRGSTLAAAAARAGLPVPVVMGARFALEAGGVRPGRVAVPVRPALVGAVTGVLGLLAAFTVAAGVDDAVAHPARFGQNYSLAAFLGDFGVDGGDSAGALALLNADEEITGLLDLRYADGASGATAVTVFDYRPVGEGLPIVLTAGWEPRDATEVVLAPSTARILGAAPGAIVPISGDRGVRNFVVSGIGFVPEGTETGSYTDGVWLSPDGYDALFSSFTGRGALIGLAPGVDPAAAAERLMGELATHVDGGENIGIFSGLVPQRAAEVEAVRELPMLLGGFLAVLAAAAVGQAVTAAVRHRRGDLAVLRALGMSRRQTASVVLCQAGVLVAVGLVLGIPLGIALGRTVWRIVADLIPLHYLPPVPALAVALAVPLALVVAGLVALWPARVAVRMRVHDVLRAE